ncbi:hypothetical protein GJ496_003275, partial [Pomphorhynchus laevis]
WGKLARAGVSLRKYRHQWVFQAHENYMSYLQMDVLCTAKCISEQLPDHRSILRENFFSTKSKGKNEDKRVVITWLKENFPRLSPKEKDIKPVARMFAVTSMKIRSYVVITEDMIARNLLLLIPEITMKDNFRELAEKMIKYTSNDSKIGMKNPPNRFKNFFMSIDFEKWSTNMRNDVVYEPFKFIDNLFGFNNLISRTHEIFSKSLIYTSDKDYLPIWQADSTIPRLNDYTWLGHLGGFEGLRQKAWGKLARAGVSLRKYRHQWVFQAHENYMSYLQMDVLCTAKCISEQLPDHR